MFLCQKKSGVRYLCILYTVSLSQSLLCYITTKGYGTTWLLITFKYLRSALVFLCLSLDLAYRIIGLHLFVLRLTFFCENMYNGTVNHQGYSWADVVTFKWVQSRAVSKAMSCP